MGRFGQDLKYAARSLRSAPGVAGVIVLSMALGIGATTAVLCWMENVLWNPLAGVARQWELVVLVSNQGGGNVSALDLRDFAALSEVVAGACASQTTPASFSTGDRSEWVYGQVVTANFFDVLEVKPLLGRTFLRDEDARPGGNPVIVIGETYWRRRMGGDPNVIGRTVSVNRHAFTIVGVVPAAFRGTMTGLAYEFWAPLSMENEVGNRSGNSMASRGARGYHNVVRLRPGVSLARAQAAVSTLNRQLSNAYPQTNREVVYRVVSLADSPYGAQQVMGATLRLLLSVSVGVLLIVTANVANLLLGRAAARRKEIAIRLASGASRWHLVRQLVTESLVLALLGGALGVVLASWMVSLLRSFLPEHGIMPNIALSYTLDWRTVGLAILVTLATGLLFGLVPALQASRPQLYETLKEGGRSSAGAIHHRLRHALVMAEVGLALVLLVGAGLCIKGLQKAREIDFGFDPTNVLIADLQVGMNGYTEETGKVLYRQMQQRLRELPGVQEVALVSWFPLGLGGCKGAGIQVEGYERPRGEDTTYEYVRVSPGYFSLMRIPLLAGRDFSELDNADSTAVAIVNEHFARRFWPGQDPIGRRFRAKGKWRTIVGVAKAGKYNRLNEPAWCFFYLPYQQGVPDLDLSVSVRTTGRPEVFAGALQRAIHEIDPGVDVVDTKTLSAHTSAIFFAQRIASILLMLLGGIGVVLAAMGVYAVMAYAVSQRTQEFGLRLAIGASQQDLSGLVVRNGLALALFGSAMGLVVAFGVTRLLSGFLYGVSPFDPFTFAGVPLFLGGVTVLACWLPARRAARVDPMVALRCE